MNVVHIMADGSQREKIKGKIIVPAQILTHEETRREIGRVKFKSKTAQIRQGEQK